jgi:uncharacterized repeat protein (TIGR03803 family)
MKEVRGSAVLRVSVALCVAILALSSVASAQQAFRPIYSFNPADGGVLNGKLIQGTDGALYGTAYAGGPFNGGTIFKVTLGGALTVLHAFPFGQGSHAGLIQASDGNFYGTTSGGGSGPYGTVFKMTPAGVVTTLHTFAGAPSDGANPYSALIQGLDGNLYGTTTAGGAFNDGTIYKITPGGSITILHSFGGYPNDGEDPTGGLLQLADGSFWATTTSGGAFALGTAFTMTSGGAVTVVHSFGEAPTFDFGPTGALVFASGNFYGTTPAGGGTNGSANGTIFRMSLDGTVTTLHTFAGATDGQPSGTLYLASDGNFYGTTLTGGANGYGTVFRFALDGTLTTLDSFSFATTGYWSDGGLIQASDGNLYGASQSGGPSGNGVVFCLSPNAAAMTSPPPASNLGASTVTFTWVASSGATAYWLDIGTAIGGSDLFSQSAGLSTSQSVSGLPVLGETVYVRLWTQVGGGWQFNDYTYTAYSAKATMTSPVANSFVSGPTVTFTWSTPAGASEYWLEIGSSSGQGNFFEQSVGVSASMTVGSIPVRSGALYVRLWTRANGRWAYNDYIYSTANLMAVMISPGSGSTLTGTSATLTWSTSASASQYWLEVGTGPGKSDLFGQSVGLATSQTVNGLPNTGAGVFVRLWSQINGIWFFNDYTYTAFYGGSTLTSPAPSSRLSGATVTFTWNATAAASQYWLQVGTTTQTNSLFDQSVGLATSQTVSGLPLGGGNIVVTLWTQIGGSWLSRSALYTAFDSRAVMTSPVPSTLTGSSVTFTWTSGTGATAYWLDVGTFFGRSDLVSQSAGLSTSLTVTLPVTGDPVYVRLWTQVNGVWYFNSYNYTTFKAKAVLALPVPGPALTQSTVQFVWNSVAGASEYWLDVGTAPGSGNIFSASTGTSTSQTVSGIPTGADAIHVRLWTLFGGLWQYTDWMYGGHVITFGGVAGNGSPFTAYSESGFTVNATSGPWTVNTQFGHPAPFIWFQTPVGPTRTTAELTIVPSAGPFQFNSIDLYISIPLVSYEITGTGSSGTVFTLTGSAGNISSGFVTVTNPQAAESIDQLHIKLTSPMGSSTCCANAIGLDNISLSY